MSVFIFPAHPPFAGSFIARVSNAVVRVAALFIRSWFREIQVLPLSNYWSSRGVRSAEQSAFSIEGLETIS
jgi:hypothetical protein